MGFNGLQWVYSGLNGIDDVKTVDDEKYNGAKPSRHDDLRGETRNLMGYNRDIVGFHGGMTMNTRISP